MHNLQKLTRLSVYRMWPKQRIFKKRKTEKQTDYCMVKVREVNLVVTKAVVWRKRSVERVSLNLG